MGTTLRVTGLDHIVLVSADVERTLAWYCDLLGLEPDRVDEWREGKVPFPSVRLNAHQVIHLFAGESTGDNDARGGGSLAAATTGGGSAATGRAGCGAGRAAATGGVCVSSATTGSGGNSESGTGSTMSGGAIIRT